MSLFDKDIIKKDLSPRTILEQEVSRVVESVYHDIQYRINSGQTRFKLSPKEYGWREAEITSDVWRTFIDWLYWELEKLKERLAIKPMEWNGANFNISNISPVVTKKEKIVVDIAVNYKIFKPKRLIGEPHILEEKCEFYQYTFEEFERPLKKSVVTNMFA